MDHLLNLAYTHMNVACVRNSLCAWFGETKEEPWLVGLMD